MRPHAFTQITDEDRCYCGLPVDAPSHSSTGQDSMDGDNT